MSDSFGDLWASSNPVKSQSQSLGRLASSTTAENSGVTSRTTLDAFSVLASTSSSRSNSRPVTPVIKPQPAASRSPISTTGDAFGGLVSFGDTSGSRDGSLTIAERAAKAERERREKIEKDNIALKSQKLFWDKYDVSLPDKGSGTIAPTISAGEWDFDLLTPVNTTSKPQRLSPSIQRDTTWELDFTVSDSVPVTTHPSRQIADIFDLDELAELGNGRLSHSTESSPANTGNFDSGDHEHQVVHSHEEEDDILGVLARPVGDVRKIPDDPSLAPARPTLSHRQSASPPPHILGRIVEMGFSVQQAKVALASTSTGFDVDAALEILLRDGTSTPPHREQTSSTPELKPKRTVPLRNNISSAVSDPSSSRLDISPAQQGLQDHADKLLAQASSIGLSMFSKANALWKEGKEKVAKAYDEQRLGNAADDISRGKGRPKWMGEAMITDENNGPSTPTDVYKSPARRRLPVLPRSEEDVLSPITPATPPPVMSIPTPLPPLSRPKIELSSSAMSSSNAHKALGTEHFKLGRFAEAESSYSHAIDSLPVSHLLRVPLYNNRALARLKIGEYKGSIQDTTEALRIVTGDLGTAWHPGREAVQADINLGEAVSKALRRRAEANEGLEKWKEASIDWEWLNVTPWTNQMLKMDAAKGIGRCRGGVATHQDATAFPPSNLKPDARLKPKPKQEPVPASSSARPGEALSRVRAANAAQEKEDQDRHDLKDIVDTRLEAWRTGKETNIRALIASLDTVLPSTFGWQKVGMAELVTPKQVKIRYTKAIARLHPDKLNTNNTTLEERMIANGVFGTLNEAWNATRE
ncbi:hypothetical protein BU17DRAFT_57572 [Hysterangium stoloniferum]|nr:hypothetical protein BU17DRAFT_57572 [Hysterangium stoloniferum]